MAINGTGLGVLNEVQTINLTIDENKVILGAKEVIKIIRPNWNQDDVKFKMFTDGITNKLVGCCQSNFNTDKDVILVRIYGNKTDLLIDRKAETRNFKVLNRFGFAPRLYATINNGLVYEFVPGCTLNPNTVTSPTIWPLVARQMARMHKINLVELGVESTEPVLCSKVRQFLKLVPNKFTNLKKQKLVEQTFPSLEDLKQEFEDLYNHLKELQSPIVFSHNDLLLGNVIYTEKENRVTFIDYEYAACNYQAYDLGNHFQEYAGVEDIDYNLYPSENYQKDWLRVYLEEFLSGKEVTDEAIHKLYVQVNKFALSAHFLWAVWALIQTEHSTIDFDFLTFGKAHFNEYRAKREQFLALN